MEELLSLEQELSNQVSKAETLEIDLLDDTIAGSVLSDPYCTASAAGSALHALSRRILWRLQSDERFRNLSDRWFDYGYGPVPLRLPDVAIALLRVAIVEGVDSAIQWLCFVNEQQDARGFLVLAVWGIDVDSPVEITSDISLLPLDDVPDSYAKRMLLGGSGHDSMHTPFDYEIPKCALLHRACIRDLRTPPLVLESTSTVALARPTKSRNTPDRKRMHAALSELVLLLGVFGPQISIPAVSWFTFEDQRLERLRVGTTRYLDSVEVIPLHIPEMPALSPSEVTPLLGTFLNLAPAVRAQLSVALERLSLALRRHDAADKAVELSIALESLVSDGAVNEVTHKANVRAVRLLAGNDETRERNSAIIRATYKMRSKLVHQGKRKNETVKIGTDTLSALQITEECAKLCSALIIKIANIGSFPSWATFDIS